MESACEECLCRELALRGIRVERQLPLPVEQKGVRLDCGYRLDLLVAQSVVVEIKSLSSIGPIHEAQLPTCLKPGGSNGKSLRFARRAGIKGRHTSENSMSFSPLCVSAVVNGYTKSSPIKILSETISSKTGTTPPDIPALGGDLSEPVLPLSVLR